MKNQKVNENPMNEIIAFLIYSPFPHLGQRIFIIMKKPMKVAAIRQNSIKKVVNVNPILKIEV